MKPIRTLALGPLSAAALLGAGELIARHRLGLGTPPLYVADPLTEYRLKPHQNLRRFGSRIQVNAFSMRAAPLSPMRPVAARRVLVFGDSVVWGGSLQPGNRWIAQLLQQEGVPSVQSGPIFHACGPIASLYTDGIHPYTAAGQACLAKAIAQALALASG